MDAICIDIGNTHIALALFLNNQLEQVERLPAGNPQGLSERIRALRGKCGPQPLGARTVPVVVSSVNPATCRLVEEAVADALDQRILLIGRDVPLDIKYAVEDIEAVGADRLLTAAAAYAVVEDAVVVADFGTATTIDCVDHYGIFLGGAILPGLTLQARSLHEHTALLPEVRPDRPAGDYGTNTVQAIQHGLFYGAIGALRGIVERYAALLGRWPHVVLTGGFAELLAPEADFVDSTVPHLCLNGIFLAYKKHREQQQAGLDAEMDQVRRQLGAPQDQAQPDDQPHDE